VGCGVWDGVAGVDEFGTGFGLVADVFVLDGLDFLQVAGLPY